MVGQSDNTGLKNALQASSSAVSYMRRYTLTGVAGISTADEDIDGRLPATLTTKSETLNELLTEEASEAHLNVSDHIIASSNLSELKTAGAMLAELPDGKDKEALKKEWHKMKAIITSDKAKLRGANAKGNQ
jgi:hypothetical protein